MATYRDLSIPYTEDEIKELLSIVKLLPTYKNGSVSSADLPEMMERWNWFRTPEQTQAYIDFFDKMHGGRLSLGMIQRNLGSFHDTSLLAKEQMLNFDRDGNGYITKDEFQDILKCMTGHDPRLKEKTYEEFLAEADTNKDGRVSVEESTAWIAKYTA